MTKSGDQKHALGRRQARRLRPSRPALRPISEFGARRPVPDGALHHRLLDDRETRRREEGSLSDKIKTILVWADQRASALTPLSKKPAAADISLQSQPNARSPQLI